MKISKKYFLDIYVRILFIWKLNYDFHCCQAQKNVSIKKQAFDKITKKKQLCNIPSRVTATSQLLTHF